MHYDVYQREFMHAAKCFAKVVGIKWPGRIIAQEHTAGHLCDLAAEFEYSDSQQAARLLNAERALHRARGARPGKYHFGG